MSVALKNSGLGLEVQSWKIVTFGKWIILNSDFSSAKWGGKGSVLRLWRLLSYPCEKVNMCLVHSECSVIVRFSHRIRFWFFFYNKHPKIFQLEASGVREISSVLRDLGSILAQPLSQSHNHPDARFPNNFPELLWKLINSKCCHLGSDFPVPDTVLSTCVQLSWFLLKA